MFQSSLVHVCIFLFLNIINHWARKTHLGVVTTLVSAVTGVEIVAADFIKPVSQSYVHRKDGGGASPDVFSNRCKGGVHLLWYFKVDIVLKQAPLCPCLGRFS